MTPGPWSTIASVLSTPWPWVALLGVAFLWMFRDQIRAFMGRLRRVGRGNWAAEADSTDLPQQKELTSATEALASKAGDAVPGARDAAERILATMPRNDYVTLQEDQIKTALKQLKLPEESAETTKVLVAFLATANTRADFYALYNTIWGSQIFVLDLLNERVDLSDDDLRKIYDRSAEQSPNAYAPYSFEQWLRFLEGQGLIQPSAPGRRRITLKGRTFLLFLVNDGLSKLRAIY